MSYHMFRMSLMRRQPPPLLEAMQPPSPVPDRQAYLKQVLAGRIDFSHRGAQFSFVKVIDIGDVIAGRIGRPGTEHLTGGPETGFAPKDHAGHNATNIFIDIASDPSGQKIAFKVNSRVGSPKAIVTSLCNAINTQNVDGHWHLDVRPMIDESSFWDVVNEYLTEITKIQLTLVAPNILGFRDGVSNAMKATRDENNAATVTIALENKDGLHLATESIKSAVHYVSEGGGDAILKRGRKKLFDSKRKARSIDVPKDETVAQENAGVLSVIKEALFGR